jgi:hypothetical protein
MINYDCEFCSPTSGGNHQLHCPLSRKSEFARFLDTFGSDSNIELRPFDSLIEKYMGLMSAYMMTVDLLEVAGETFGPERLEAVADYVLDKLDICISEIVSLQEKKSDG